MSRSLCSKNEYTKSESNSQPISLPSEASAHCVQRTNIQNLKAIHNFLLTVQRYCKLCSKNEYTKSESNSQPISLPSEASAHCVQRTNIQNLKAIHNFLLTVQRYCKLCSKNEYTKSESNSQLLEPTLLRSLDCVQRTNIQNLKAIHNLTCCVGPFSIIVFKERIYKI